MPNQISERVEAYIKSEYTGGLISLSDLVVFCDQPKWDIYRAIEDLQSQGKVAVITLYFCPESHSIPSEDHPYCARCELKYSNTDIVVAIYINWMPKKEEKAMDESELELDVYGTAIAEGDWVALVEPLEWEGGSLPANTQFQYSYNSIEQNINGDLVYVDPEELRVV